MKDLFGDEITDDPGPIGQFKKKGLPKGYAAPPGSGPAGETCRTCKHYRSVPYHDKTYPKCILMFKHWNHSYGSDIRAKSPACKHWTMPEFEPEKMDVFRPRSSIRL